MGLVPQKQTSMKKILTSLILFAALAVMPASAQIKFGVKGGMNNTSLKLDYENAFSNKAGYGWFIGPTVKASFPLGVINLGADAAVLYGRVVGPARYAAAGGICSDASAST